jgi:hypothetical protein
MGAIESYVAAPLFAVAGSSTVALRIPLLIGYAVCLVLAYRLTARLYDAWLAVVVVGLLALGADRVVKDQLIAGGGYPELLPVGTAAVLLAVALAAGTVRRRFAGFTA